MYQKLSKLKSFLEMIAISISKLYVHFWSHEYEYDDKGNRSIMCQLASSCWFLAYLNTGRQSLLFNTWILDDGTLSL